MSSCSSAFERDLIRKVTSLTNNNVCSESSMDPRDATGEWFTACDLIATADNTSKVDQALYLAAGAFLIDSQTPQIAIDRATGKVDAKVLLRAAKAARESPDAHVILGVVALVEGKPSIAHCELSGAIELLRAIKNHDDERLAAVYYVRSSIAATMNNMKSARDDLLESVRLNSNRLTPCAALVQTLGALEKHGDAVDHVEKLLERFPDFTRGHLAALYTACTSALEIKKFQLANKLYGMAKITQAQFPNEHSNAKIMCEISFMAMKEHTRSGDRECVNCGVVAARVSTCGRCRSAVYCSAACQKGDWVQHRLNCKSSSSN